MEVGDVFVLRTLLLFALAATTYFTLAGCSSVGTGRSTLVLGRPPEGASYHGEEFASLLTDSRTPILRATGAGKPMSTADWAKLLHDRFGADTNPGAPPQIGSVTVTVRDRTRTPAFSGGDLDSVEQDKILALLLDAKISPDDKQKLLLAARNNYETLPESRERVVFDRYIAADDPDPDKRGLPIWRYFVELEIDLTGTLQSADPDLRFDYVAAAVRIPDGVQARFINFEPKAADLYALAIGTLKNTASLEASAKQGGSAGTEDTSDSKPSAKRETTSKATTGATSEAGLSLNLSEEMTREIKAGLDLRSAGIYNDGKVFLVELRSTDLRRIAGTYTYKVMLEVRSDPRVEGSVSFSQPQAEKLALETRTIGVVRHLVHRGRSGLINRVPEPLNDTTFNQVIAHDGTIAAWEFGQAPRGEALQSADEPENLVVRTAFDDAAVVLRRTGGNREVLGFASGRQATFRVEPKTPVIIEFLPILHEGTQAVEFTAPSQNIEIPAEGSATVVGGYRVSRTFPANHARASHERCEERGPAPSRAPAA